MDDLLSAQELPSCVFQKKMSVLTAAFYIPCTHRRFSLCWLQVRDLLLFALRFGAFLNGKDANTNPSTSLGAVKGFIGNN